MIKITKSILLLVSPLVFLACPHQQTYRSVATEQICQDCPLEIPKIIHQVWHQFPNGSKDPPIQWQKFSHELQKKYPDWEFKSWDLETCRQFVRHFYPEFLETYDNYDKPIKRADAIRYLLLDHYGGLYMDRGFKNLKDFEPLLRGAHFVAGQQNPKERSINNAWMASTPGHPLLKRIIADLPGKAERDVIYSTGPIMLTEQILDFKSKRPEDRSIKIYAEKYLYPFAWYDKEAKDPADCRARPDKCAELYPDAYFVKFWGASWVEK